MVRVNGWDKVRDDNDFKMWERGAIRVYLMDIDTVLEWDLINSRDHIKYSMQGYKWVFVISSPHTILPISYSKNKKEIKERIMKYIRNN